MVIILISALSTVVSLLGLIHLKTTTIFWLFILSINLGCLIYNILNFIIT
jgi:hypothetical protein